MGCILACLRYKYDKKKKKAYLKSSPVPSKSKEPFLSKDLFGSLFISEGFPCEQVADQNSRDNSDKDILDREFRDEVKFLKSCGAILETPPELGKASGKLIAQPPNKDITSSISSSCLSGTPFKKLVWDEQQEDSDFARSNCAVFNFGEKQAQRHNDCTSSKKVQWHDSTLSPTILRELATEPSIFDVSPTQDDTQVQSHGTKGSAFFGSVMLDPRILSGLESAVLDVSPSQDDTQIQALDSEGVCLRSAKHDSGTEPGVVSIVSDVSPCQDDTRIQPVGSTHSPYPTPLKLTDEMETPGTVYPASFDNLRRKNARIRAQYVYPVLNPVENLTRLSKLTEGSKQLVQSGQPQQTPIASSPTHHKDKKSPISDPAWKVTPRPENRMVSSLSEWLKPPPGDEEKSQIETSAMKYSCAERTPDVERSIFGAVAMHWNEDDSSKVSPKFWGGNGIPNTTTKYKEDQKVSWHATPFEERLDKALSDDKLFPHRKDIRRNLVAFKDVGEESDIASF